MVQAARGTNGQDGQDGQSGKNGDRHGEEYSIGELIEQIEQCIFEMADGDFGKYEIIERMPGDLFFKWLRWRRRDERRRMEWEAALHGVRLGESGSSTSSSNKSESIADVAGNFRGKMVFEKVKVSKEEKARRMEEMKRKKAL